MFGFLKKRQRDFNATVVPAGDVLEVKSGENLLKAALAAGNCDSKTAQARYVTTRNTLLSRMGTPLRHPLVFNRIRAPVESETPARRATAAILLLRALLLLRAFSHRRARAARLVRRSNIRADFRTSQRSP